MGEQNHIDDSKWHDFMKTEAVFFSNELLEKMIQDIKDERKLRDEAIGEINE